MAPRAAASDNSRGRLLKTTTRLVPYGHASKARAVSKVFRPMTIVSTVAMRLVVPVWFAAASRQPVEIAILPRNEAINAGTDED